MDEVWAAVPGYEGRYEVSTHGRVKSVRSGRIMRGGISSSGYPRVTLMQADGGMKYVCIHRLVALAFLGPPPTPTHEVCHNDGGRTNNHLSNLRWGTHAENMLDMSGHGVGQGAKTHCIHGHEFTPENTYVTPNRAGFQRVCRTCRRAIELARRERAHAWDQERAS